MASEHNALAELAELAERLKGIRKIGNIAGVPYEKMSFSIGDIKLASRIIAELAKVQEMERMLEKENKDFLPVSVEIGIRYSYQSNCINRCRAIAEEGATDDR